MTVQSCADLFARAGSPWISERDRREMRPEPPSKAHVRRLKRDRDSFREPIVPAKELSDHAQLLRMAREFRHARISREGGSRTVAPTRAAAEKTAKFGDFSAVRMIPHDRELTQRERWERDAQAIQAQIDKLARDHAAAAAKARSERELFEARFANMARAYAHAMNADG